MLRSLNSLLGNTLGATDGEVGRVRDFYFDDHEWTIRYLVAETGHWLPGRLVLISPSALGRADYARRMIHVNLTRNSIEMSPPADSQRPISRQHEAELSRYFGWPAYWNPAIVVGGAGIAWSPRIPEPEEERSVAGEHHSQEDPNLRSLREITGYHVEANDGPIGHVEDLIVDDQKWSIQYVVIDTRNWWPAKKVVMLPMWISQVSWEARQVHFDLPRQTIEDGPRYDPKTPINEEHETRFYDYYGRPRTW